MNEQIDAGFTYLVEVLKDGVVVDSEVVHNLLPTEGINHLLNVTLRGGTQYATWYVGLFEGNYTPTASDTAAAFPGNATETTTYAETTRQTWTPGTVVSGVVDNSASTAQFTSNALKTVYGGFITSAPAKSATTGVLLSVVRFSTAKTFDVGSILRVTGGFTMTSV
jgi:hypothetical protein